MHKRDFIKLLGLSGLAAGAGLTGARVSSPDRSACVAAHASDKFYDILKRGTIRSGYVVYAPNFIRDPNSGQFSGIFYDLMEHVGKSLGLKVEWTEEAGLTELTAGLETGRLDVVASGLWSNAARSRVVDYSKPVFFNTLNVYVRKGETRFKNFASLNQTDVRIAVIDGGMADQLGTSDFPRAEKVSLPANTDYPFLLKVVASNKADFTVSASHEFEGYNRNNPGELEALPLSLPIRVFPNVIFVGKGQERLRTMIDAALDEQYYAGVTNSLVDRYEEFKGSFYKLNAPYLSSATS